jgi:hypothetical protein
MTQRYAHLSPDFIDREQERMDTISTPAPQTASAEAAPEPPKYLQ